LVPVAQREPVFEDAKPRKSIYQMKRATLAPRIARGRGSKKKTLKRLSLLFESFLSRVVFGCIIFSSFPPPTTTTTISLSHSFIKVIVIEFIVHKKRADYKRTVFFKWERKKSGKKTQVKKIKRSLFVFSLTPFPFF
jgi:hypothetical protein